jgi:hypothetical protein
VSTKLGTVTGVYANTNPESEHYGQQMLNVDAGGPMSGVVNGHPGAYFPRVGDSVGLTEFGDGLWAVTAWFTANRGPVIPHVPTVTLANAGPTGWTQIAQFFADPAVSTNMDLVGVPTTVVVPSPSTAGTYEQQGGITSRGYRYDFGGSWTHTFAPHQGLYVGPEGTFGPWDGAWFYPDLTAALSGKTITGFRIYLHRAGEGGSAGAVQTHLYLHNHASTPAGAPTFTDGPLDPAEAALSWNVAAWVPLPVAWAVAIQNGTAKGIGIRADDTASYSILLGTDADPASGRLSFDYA